MRSGRYPPDGACFAGRTLLTANTGSTTLEIWRGLPSPVGTLVVRTSDFRLAYRLLEAMKRKRISCVQIPHDAPLPEPQGIWLATPEEVAESNLPGGVGCTVEEIELGIEQAQRLANWHGPVSMLAFGIDPGPRPGLAWLGDGLLLGVEQLEGIDETVDRIGDLLRTIEHERAVVRIGDGSPTIGTRLANVSLTRGLEVERVDESTTSAGTPRHQHHVSAARIAQLEGVPVRDRRPVRPTPGEVREIQDRSRKQSDGQLTLPGELAQAVAVGRLSMTEALDEQRRRGGNGR